MEVECETSVLAKTAETRQHFFSVDWFARVYRINESVATFFLFFLRISQMKRISGVKNETPERQTRHDRARMRTLFSFW